ncbi:MAG: hypothetical protein ACNYWU_11365 [Desulfobacterales bacterium]
MREASFQSILQGLTIKQIALFLALAREPRAVVDPIWKKLAYLNELMTLPARVEEMDKCPFQLPL